MKNLRKLAGVSILLIIVFMVIELARFQKEEKEMSLLPEQIEYYYNENWKVIFLENTNKTEEGLEDYNITMKKVKESLADGKYQKTSLPYTNKENINSTIIFSNVLPEEYAGLTINFSSIDAIVRVSLDGEVIYESGTSEEEDKKVYGSSDNFVDIPNVFQKGELWIELLPVRKDAETGLSGVKIETRDMAFIGIVGNNIADIVCCILIMIMAIIMFVLTIIRCYTRQPDRGEVFLGLAGVVSSTYCFIGTDTLSIFYNINEAYAMQDYLVLLVPVFLTLYFERNLYKIYPRRFSLLIWCVSISAIIQVLLQISGLQDLENMSIVSAVVTWIVYITVIISMVQFNYKNKQYQIILSIIAMFILLSGSIANFIINIFSKYAYGNIAGQYSMVGFSIITAVMHILQISKEYRASAERNAQLLEEKNEAKGRFLAHMSHEIRTPINAVLGMDEMILRESKEQNIKDYAMDIYTAGQTLLALVNDILDFSKIDSGKMEIVPAGYDTSMMIHDLSNMASQRAAGKNIEFKTEVNHEIPSRLYGDDVRIRQVLANILTNAVKYTHNGTVCFRIQCHQKNDTAVLKFEVEDTGIGIKEEDLPKLFTEFERIEENRNRNIEGTGLGMNITTKLLSLMGSRLQVESEYGKGSKFYFELEQKIIDYTPIGDFESRVHQIAKNYSYNTKFFAPDASILVVDDNSVNRKVLRNLLKETQIQITDASGGMECLELVQKNHYDLVFLDHMMPGMDGVETLHHIKELSDYPCKDTPIIVLTANAVSGAEEKYLSEGFDGFLSKPVMPDKLESIIKKILPAELLLESVSFQKETGLQQQAVPDTPSISIEELPLIDGLDWNYAWLHLPDMGLLEYTIKEFYSQIGPAADRLGQIYENITEPGQTEQYRIQVHAMKSLASTVGIVPLAGLAKILEYAAKDSKISIIMSMTETFLEEWHSYSKKLQGVFGIGADKLKRVEDYSVIQAIIEMIRISMQDMDIDKADQLAGQLLEYEYPEETGQNIMKLTEAVTNLNPEETDRIAGLLIGQIQIQNNA